MFFPQVNFLLKRITITPSKFIDNSIIQNIKDHFDSLDLRYGYVSFAKNNETDLKILLLDKDDPSLFQKQAVTVIGVWIVGKLYNRELTREGIFWSTIMEYLTNPLLKFRLSINFPRTGILLSFESAKKYSQYLFEVP